MGGIFFPDEPRQLPGHRTIKIVLRGVHTLCAGVLTGAWLLDGSEEQRLLWLACTVVTGACMLLIDLFESAAFLLQVRGLVLALKVGLLVALPLFGQAGGWVLAALMVLAVVSSHAPSKVRYRLVFGRGRVHGATSRG